MKLKFIAIPVLAASAVLSCTKNELTSPKEAEIVVQAGVTQTRAGYEEGTLPESFVMDIVQNSDPKYDYTGVVMTKDGDRYIPKVKMVWAGTEYSKVNVKAMTVPYGKTTDDINADEPIEVSVNPDQRSAANILASDLLVADSNNGDVPISGSKIKINFRHLMSKLQITCKFAQDLDVTINSVTLGNICVKGQYSYADMAIPEQCEYELGDIAMLVQNGQSPTFEALFFPYNPTENPILTVNATIAGESRVMTCEITPKKSGFVSGKRYTLTVTINDTAITPTSETFTIDTKWEDGNEDEDFELDFGSDSENGDDVFITD